MTGTRIVGKFHHVDTSTDLIMINHKGKKHAFPRVAVLTNSILMSALSDQDKALLQDAKQIDLYSTAKLMARIDLSKYQPLSYLTI